MRQIYPGPEATGAAADLTDPDLAGRYAYPAAPGLRRPWVRANMIASTDGAASLDGLSGGLSGPADRRVFAVLRALADVILVGAGTAADEGYRPVRPGPPGGPWARLREGRTATPPIAVVTGQLNLGPGSPLLTGAPPDARTIVITCEAAPADRRAALAGVADLIVAGTDRVDLGAALEALAGLGHRRVLAEGGPHLLGQLAAAGLLDELCLTVSPLLAGGTAGRIVSSAGIPGAVPAPAVPLALGHVLEDDGFLLCRYLRRD